MGVYFRVLVVICGCVCQGTGRHLRVCILGNRPSSLGVYVRVLVVISGRECHVTYRPSSLGMYFAILISSALLFPAGTQRAGKRGHGPLNQCPGRSTSSRLSLLTDHWGPPRAPPPSLRPLPPPPPPSLAVQVLSSGQLRETRVAGFTIRPAEPPCSLHAGLLQCCVTSHFPPISPTSPFHSSSLPPPLPSPPSRPPPSASYAILRGFLSLPPPKLHPPSLPPNLPTSSHAYSSCSPSRVFCT